MSLKPAISAEALRSIAIASILICVAISVPAFAQEQFPDSDPLALTDHRGETFEGFDFRGRDLSLGNYEGAKLHAASFAGAELDRVTFDGADLRETSGWAEADLGLGIHAAGAIFDEANLAGATCDGFFEQASFRDANLSNATLSGRFDGATFDRANVTGALFLGASGTETLHDDLRTRGAIVDGAGFADASTAGRSFRGAMLDGDDLSDLDLAGADLAEANLHSARLVGSNLSGANLQKALLAWARADGANFGGAKLAEANCTGFDANDADFREANLVATEFCNADLQRADFANADLTNADLRGADLSEANLEGAKLAGVRVENAILDGVKGLPEAELAAMRSQAARWRYDLERGWQEFLRSASLPLHVMLSALALGLTILGGAVGRMRPSFALLASVNAAALVPFALFVLFSLAGGSPVAQMSSFEMWQLWLNAWPSLLVWVAATGFFAGGFGVWEVVGRSIAGPRNLLPLSIAMAVATLLNCFFAYHVLFQIAPDA